MTPVTWKQELRDWVGSVHAIPSLVVASLTALFAWSVGLTWGQVAVVWGAMLANQTGIGLGNDIIDSESDRRAGRPDKPIARRVLSPRIAWFVAAGLGVLALGLSSVLGWWALLCQMVMLASGWWYNLHAKRHWSSGLSYLIGFGLLPVFPHLARTSPYLPDLWIISVAALLGVSAHFANALPDIQEDRASGVQGLPQRIGPQASGIVLAIGVVVATGVISVFGTTLPLWLRLATSLCALLGAGLAAWLAFSPRPPRVIFPLVMVSAGISTLAIAAAGAMARG